MVEPDNIVLEHLPAIPGDMGKLVGEMQRLGRIEKRLELAD